ncbi:cupin domain-containing protein [Phenylobacterium montanum]|uniref:Cupin domain-containing protein n=1 Tax=Phenylobacterium montanum TaxID=2823693 RepID=A0A975FXY4_9CAUL|nr:cupin domain-containing protein [Caulobacter sp. S6]QUD87470.1 cupin domain-containing protein [Caulobacter sp. S6]
MPKIDLDAIEPALGCSYPAPYDQPLARRTARDVGAAGGLTDFVAIHVVLPPGCWSSQRHWHEGEDELVAVLSGEAVLIDDHGRRPMKAGDVATFPKNDGNGHYLINESDRDCILIGVSLPERSLVHYPDIDLLWSPETGETHVDGTPY